MSKSNKKLLNENTVRHFMKLAKLKPLTENFVNKIFEGDDEEEKEDEMEFSPGGSEESEPPMPSPAPEGEEVSPAEPPMGGGMEDKVEDIISAIAEAIAKETGVQISVESDEGGESAEPPVDEMPESEPKGELEPAPEEETDIVKEEKTLVSGDRTEQSEDQRELPAHDQVVEESTAMFGATAPKKQEYKAAPKAKLNESKKPTKQQMIKVIAERVSKRLMELRKPSAKPAVKTTKK